MLRLVHFELRIRLTLSDLAVEDVPESTQNEDTSLGSNTLQRKAPTAQNADPRQQSTENSTMRGIANTPLTEGH